jgi:hypothetical protein
MTGSADLERRYRRLLKFFPARYRREHEQLLLVGGILLSDGYWWGVLVFVAAALHFYFAYRLRHTIQS